MPSGIAAHVVKKKDDKDAQGDLEEVENFLGLFVSVDWTTVFSFIQDYQG